MRRFFPVRVPARLKGLHRTAYIIGRISMAWGEIEQRLYSDIVRFQQSQNKNLYPHEAEIAPTFDGRVKQWRRLCKSITNALSHVDRAITKLRRLSSIRHHVAHGYPIYLPGFRDSPPLPTEPFVQIIEHRETVTRLLRHIKLAEKNKLPRVWASDLFPTYTLTELEEKWKELEQLNVELLAASDAVIPFPKPPKLPKPLRTNKNGGKRKSV